MMAAARGGLGAMLDSGRMELVKGWLGVGLEELGVLSPFCRTDGDRDTTGCLCRDTES